MDELLARYATPTYLVETDARHDATLVRVAEALRVAPRVTAVERAHVTLRVTVRGDAAPRRLLAAPQRRGRAVICFERQRPTLEDVFLRLVGPPGSRAAA